MTRAAFLALLLFGLATGARAAANDAGNGSPAVEIGYVSLDDDARYADDNAYAGIVFRTIGRPLPGAQLGIQDAQTLGRVIGRDFRLKTASAASADDLADIEKTVTGWARDDDVHFVIADLPADALVKLADAVKDQPLLLMNVSARDDVLRGEECRANVVHVIPSESMLSDALVEYLVAKKWPRILVLQGDTEPDAREVKALERSAKKFGASIVDTIPFSLGTDPRQRDTNNIALMTAGKDADVVFVADSSGEFGRYVPYQTARPMPVVGDAGLVATAWHWSWDRNGAPQLQHRFEKLAPPRRMNAEAWAAWVAVKAVTEATLRAGAPGFEAMRDYLLGDTLTLDGVKGNPMSFRAWDHQLRQPILLATADAVIARAPLPQYLHSTNVLDTLGVDAPETQCHM